MTWEEALEKAYSWAVANAYKSVYASCAQRYIEAIGLNRAEAKEIGESQGRADKIQLSYIIGNLGPWRGEEAREAKVAIRDRIKALSKA